MRAVNLIPVDQRRGGAGGPPFAAYGLLGGLVVLLAAVTLVVTTGNQVRDRKAELAKVTTQATAAERQASQLTPYTNFAKLQAARLSTVKSLAATRFQWSRAFDDVSHVVGTSVWLTGLTGTVTAGVTVDGATTSGTEQLRGLNTNPAIEIAGCAKTNKELVRLMSRLRAMTGVQRVSLADAAKEDSAAPAAAGGGDGSSCGSVHIPDFHLVVFYAPLAAPVASPGAAGSSTVAATSTTGTASGSTPASTSSTSSTNASTTGGTP